MSDEYAVAPLMVMLLLAGIALDLCAQSTQINSDSLRIKRNTVTKVLVPGDASVSIAMPSMNGVIAIEQAESPYPIGTVIHVLSRHTAADGYLRTDGQALSRTDYSTLFSKIGTAYGIGNGSTTFNIPTIIDPYVPKASLVGWWPFNADGVDRWFRKNNAIVAGPAASSDRYGRKDAAYYFDGINDELQVTSACFNNGWAEWTVSIWANMDAVQQGTIINTIPQNALGIGAGAGGKFQIAIGNGTVWLSNGWNTNGSYQANEWYHFCIVKNGLNVKLFVNGVLDREYTLPSAPPDLNCSLYIGRCNCAGDFAKGKLDDLGLWSRALTISEVEALYRSVQYAVIRSK